MTYENRDNSGALFKATKRDEDSPDYSGRITIGGVEHWLSAWLKTSSKTGERYMSLAARKKEVAQPTARPATRAWRGDGL